ncbi:MAG TPA: AIR synthase family protein [Nitrososphaerales archaeon]|nr:AIR synthase family protein [Nitrososphaerales archaeon]
MPAGSKLSLGKLPPEVMKRYLFEMTGARSAKVVVQPSLGLDFGVVKLGGAKMKGRFLIVSSDPITGVVEKAGWYAVNVSANDVATSGNRPEFMQSIILMPEGASERDVSGLSSEMHQTATGLGIAIVGGHTELTPGLRRPIVVTTSFATADSYVTAAGAREGDALLMTKTAGVEGTAIIGTDARFNGKLDQKTVAAAGRYFERLSVVEEAVGAYRTGVVHAMHDCTEGGVLGALYEMATASGLGLKVAEKDIPISKETKTICSAVGVDPLKLISSGTLLVAVERGEEGRVLEAISSAGSSAAVIGRFAGRRVVMTRGGSEREVKTAPRDEIWRLHERSPPA